MKDKMIKKQDFVINTRGLSFSFRNEAVLHNLNLKVERGAIYGFLGPNGAGKTTTIRLLLGLLKTPHSSIELFGKNLDTDRNSIFSKTGSLIEQPSLYEHLSGYDNLLLTAKYRNIEKERIAEILTLVNLADATDKKVAAYSLGMKQRLGLALALLGKPELLILDEPVNGLDPMGIIETRELLLKLNRELGITIFLSSHLLNEIEKLVTHIGMLTKGSLIFQGTIEELRLLNKNESVILIQTNDNTAARFLLSEKHTVRQSVNDNLEVVFKKKEQAADIARTLLDHNLKLYHLEIYTKDLEKTFIDLTQN